MMALLFFLVQVVVISLSGVMAPGPVTAVAIAKGPRNRFAGALIAVGHGVVEFPLMILLILGIGRILKLTCTQIIIGLAGGAFLLIMAAHMLRSAYQPDKQKTIVTNRSPVVLGIVLSAGNPYFLVWWATVGLALATRATGLGIWAFVMFAVVHWLCDFIWLTLLSWASFKGSVLFGESSRRIVPIICAGVLRLFGLYFIIDATLILLDFTLALS